VRAIEKESIPGTIPRPDYRRLHDIARHAIHVSESLDVSIQNIESILKHYNLYMAPKQSDSYFGADEDIHNRIESLRSYIANLRHRSTSNEKRLQNEIQLAFNTVAQANAGASVEIGRAAQIDSSAMKTFVCHASFSSAYLYFVYLQHVVLPGWQGQRLGHVKQVLALLGVRHSHNHCYGCNLEVLA